MTVPTLDIQASIEKALLAGPSVPPFVVRVTYKPSGTRQRSRTFLLVPDAGESFENVVAKIDPAAVEHYRRAIA